TGADSKIARQEQGESTWDPLNASELAPNSANGLIPSLIAWAKSQLPGNVAIVSENSRIGPVGESDAQSREIPKKFWHWNIFVILNTLTCLSRSMSEYSTLKSI